ncbi:MAG TPA: hypothetical protein VK874_03960 [Gaiellaceae bacterium]|nr:hypothetical protein [Gaiellaceae bacterium]
MQAFVAKAWEAFAAVAGPSGFGNPSAGQYVTIMHPRRFAWLHSGAGDTGVPGAPVLPGEVIVSSGIPTSLGAGTNEDVVLVVDRSALLVLAQPPAFEAFPEVGSSTLTVRLQARQYAALLSEHPAAVAKVTGLTPPSF